MDQEPGTWNLEPWTRHQEPGTKNQEPGTRNQEPGTRNREPRTGNEEPGTGNREPGTRNQEPGTWNQEPVWMRLIPPMAKLCRISITSILTDQGIVLETSKKYYISSRFGIPNVFIYCFALDLFVLITSLLWRFLIYIPCILHRINYKV